MTAYKQSYQNKGQFSKKTRCVSYETVFTRSIVCRRGIYCFELSSGLFQNPIAESFSLLLTGVFVILLFFLFFNKVPSVISHAFRQYPVLSYYLVSFGWVPYFMIAGIVFLPPAATVYEWSDETVNKVADMFNMFCNWGIPCSLLIAWGRKRLTGNSPQ